MVLDTVAGARLPLCSEQSGGASHARLQRARNLPSRVEYGNELYGQRLVECMVPYNGIL